MICMYIRPKHMLGDVLAGFIFFAFFCLRLIVTCVMCMNTDYDDDSRLDFDLKGQRLETRLDSRVKGKTKGTPLWGTHRLKVLKRYHLRL